VCFESDVCIVHCFNLKKHPLLSSLEKWPASHKNLLFQLLKNYRFGIDYIVLASYRSVLQQWDLPLNIDISLKICEAAVVLEIHVCIRCYFRKDGTLMDWKILTKKLTTMVLLIDFHIVHFSRRSYLIILLSEVRGMWIHHAIWHLPLWVCGFPFLGKCKTCSVVSTSWQV